MRREWHVRFGSKADICSAARNVRFGPKADISERLSTKKTRLRLPGGWHLKMSRGRQFEWAPAKLNESPVRGSRALSDHAACVIKA
jgi:hypothetical protein